MREWKVLCFVALTLTLQTTQSPMQAALRLLRVRRVKG